MAQQQNSGKQRKRPANHNKAYKTHLQNKKGTHKAILSDPNTNNIRAFYKSVKMLVGNQEKKTNRHKQIITYRMNLLSSSHFYESATRNCTLLKDFHEITEDQLIELMKDMHQNYM